MMSIVETVGHRSCVPFIVGIALFSSLGQAQSVNSIFVDFGRTEFETQGINNLSTAAGGGIESMILEDGAVSEFGLSLFDRFQGSGTFGGVEGSDFFGPSATRDYFYGQDGNNAQAGIELLNLDDSRMYDILFFASRQNISDNRETQYAVTATTDHEPVFINPADDAVANVNGIRPIDGSIFINVQKGSNNNNTRGYYYLNAMMIVERSMHGGHNHPIPVADLPTGDPGFSTVLLRENQVQYPVPAHDNIGAFRTRCSFSHMSYDDPIVFPGQVGAAHLHTYFGNTGADAFSTTESLANTGNSTCRGGILNRSAYWIPTPIDENNVPQVPQEARFYYKTGYFGVRNEDINPFPLGLRMVAGNHNATEQQDVAYWRCVGDATRFGTIPECGGGDVMMVVRYPQCWNGSDLDSADHQSHMAYPINGGCPNSHPVAIPAISMNVEYEAPGGTSGWTLSSDHHPGAGRGISIHGDWFAGWDEEVVDTFVELCLNPGNDCGASLIGDGRKTYYPF